MKYVKLARIYAVKNDSIVEIIDAPLNKICVASLYGRMDDKGKLSKAQQSFTVTSHSETRKVRTNVIFQVYLLGLVFTSNNRLEDNAFRFVFDEVSGERILVSDLDAKSFAEFILKLELRGLVYSTDDAMPDVPEALRRLDECKIEFDRRDRQLESLREEIAEKNNALDRQAREIAELRKKLDEQSGGSSSPGKKTSWWKRSFEKMFGSEGDPSWEG